MSDLANLVAAYIVWLALGFLFTAILVAPFFAWTMIEEAWDKWRER